MITDLEMIVRILVSFILSGLIGLEREIRKHEAGLRTHILVCTGSTLIMLTSLRVFDIYRTLAPVDPTRIAAGVITGIGFLGAGAIIRSPHGVRGLTTASSLWVVAALGLSVGCGFFKVSIFITFLILTVLLFLRKFEWGLLKKEVTHGVKREEERD
ncbi:MAG TPA: MgtC/SapB family protein [Candidatus Omnitrophota bacterium]|nr:MgtC/SapB family protein [Candidatus Omnitrophota bacterium]